MAKGPPYQTFRREMDTFFSNTSTKSRDSTLLLLHLQKRCNFWKWLCFRCWWLNELKVDDGKIAQNLPFRSLEQADPKKRMEFPHENPLHWTVLQLQLKKWCMQVVKTPNIDEYWMPSLLLSLPSYPWWASSPLTPLINEVTSLERFLLQNCVVLLVSLLM